MFDFLDDVFDKLGSTLALLFRGWAGPVVAAGLALAVVGGIVAILQRAPACDAEGCGGRASANAIAELAQPTEVPFTPGQSAPNTLQVAVPASSPTGTAVSTEPPPPASEPPASALISSPALPTSMPSTAVPPASPPPTLTSVPPTTVSASTAAPSSNQQSQQPAATPAVPASTATPTPQPILLSTPPSGFAIMSLGNMVPGDSVSSSFSIINAGAPSFGYTLSTTCDSGACSGPLWMDATNGLQLTLKRGSTVIYGPAAIRVTNLGMGVALGAGQRDTITVQVSLPAAASNSAARQTVGITFSWNESG